MKNWRIAFPYIFFLAMAGAVFWSNWRHQPADPEGHKSALYLNSDHNPNQCPPCGMVVGEEGSHSAEVKGRMVKFCSAGCKERYLKSQAETSAVGRKRLFDPICKMEVNPAWDFQSAYQDTTYYFCSRRCQESFDKDPARHLTDYCMVCSLELPSGRGLPVTYLGKTYFTCSPDHRRDFLADPAAFFMHRMWGIPDWLYYLSISLVLILSFLMFEGPKFFKNKSSPHEGEGIYFSQLGADSKPKDYFARSSSNDRIDLTQNRLIKRLVISRPIRFLAQLFMVAAFLLILFAGLFGNQNPALNIAPLLTWTIWWCGLVILIMFAGKAWCYLCPWDAIAFWMEKKRLWRKSERSAGLNLPWPRILRNIWLATFLFVGLTWIELGFGVTLRPRITAYLGLAMLVMAIVSAFLFERKSFCRYGCLVGRVSGLYAMFAGVEIRHREAEICAACRSKECTRGNADAYGCPTFEYPGRMAVNTYCIQCTECLQSCPHNNLAINLRPWGADLAVEGSPRTDEAYLSLLMLAITGFHGLTMTPVWNRMIHFLENLFSVGPIPAFSLGMFMLMGFPILIYAILVGLSYLLAGYGKDDHKQPVSYHTYFVRYAYCVLPIALFYHLAHNLEHLLMEGPKVFALFSDPFGWGWNLFGLSGRPVPPLVSLDVLWLLQVVLVGVGHIYSLWAAQKISRRTFSSEAAATRGQLPMLIGMIIFSIFSLWLLKQPMEMRTSAM